MKTLWLYLLKITSNLDFISYCTLYVQTDNTFNNIVIIVLGYSIFFIIGLVQNYCALPIWHQCTLFMIFYFVFHIPSIEYILFLIANTTIVSLCAIIKSTI